VTIALLDDHLLRDLLADDPGDQLARVLSRHQPATTNLYLHRLCKSVVAARGGALTGSWTTEQRRALGNRLVALPDTVQILPLRQLAFRMAEIANDHRISTLGAEAVAAAETLAAPLYVWEGDDGPRIRAAITATGGGYHALHR
jgi:hypothetical protein